MMVSSTNFPNFSWSMAAVPYVFWAVDHVFARKTPAAASLLAVIVSTQALAGEPVTLAATLVIAAAYGLAMDGRWRDVRGVALAAVGGAAGLLLSAVQYHSASVGRPPFDAVDNDDGGLLAVPSTGVSGTARAEVLRRLLHVEPEGARLDGRVEQRSRPVLLHDVRRRARRAARGRCGGVGAAQDAFLDAGDRRMPDRRARPVHAGLSGAAGAGAAACARSGSP